MDNIIEVLAGVEVVNLGTYEGIRIIGDNTIRTAKEHNKRVKELKSRKKDI